MNRKELPIVVWRTGRRAAGWLLPLDGSAAGARRSEMEPHRANETPRPSIHDMTLEEERRRGAPLKGDIKQKSLYLYAYSYFLLGKYECKGKKSAKTLVKSNLAPFTIRSTALIFSPQLYFAHQLTPLTSYITLAQTSDTYMSPPPPCQSLIGISADCSQPAKRSTA